MTQRGRTRCVLCALSVLLCGTIDAARAYARSLARVPSALKLSLPFPCGVRARINCAYGPRCSRAHRGHDHFSLDLSRRVFGGGRGLAVVAAAKGVVRFAGWAPGRWAYYGKIVLVEHRVKTRRGQRIRTLYAHLQRVSVVVGQRVDQSTELGTLGGSSRGKLRRLGAHLHFAVLSGDGSLGGRRSLLPEPLGRYRHLRRGMRLVACRRIDR